MICIDASLAAKWILPEESSHLALALAERCGQLGQRMIAPPLLAAEVTNALRRRMPKGGLSLDDAVVRLDHFLSLPVLLHSPAGLHRQALEIAVAHGLPAVYDAYYVALAQIADCPLWTADRRLVAAVGGRLPFVRWLGDYDPEGAP